VRLAPGIPHAHHMWAHDLRRVGRTRDAIAEFRKANELEIAYYAAEGIPAELDWHHQHNLDLLATSHQHQGQMREAEELMRRSFAMPPPYEYSAFNKKEWPGFLMGRGRLEEARGAARALVASRFAAARSLGHVTLAQTAIATGALDEARAEAALAERELDAVEPGSWSARGALQPYLDLVKGSLLLRTEPTAGRMLLEDVGSRLRALPGPDAWMQALFVLESIARTARAASHWELAESMARQMLEHDPAYAGGHYALGLAAEQRGDTAASQEAFETAALLWSTADGDLPELQRVRRAVASR
jgi:tetratricopeptide (TPR) repeat protein